MFRTQERFGSNRRQRYAGRLLSKHQRSVEEFHKHGFRFKLGPDLTTRRACPAVALRKWKHRCRHIPLALAVGLQFSARMRVQHRSKARMLVACTVRRNSLTVALFGESDLPERPKNDESCWPHPNKCAPAPTCSGMFTYRHQTSGT